MRTDEPRGASVRGEFRFPHGLSVFFPAFNDALALPALLDKTFTTLEKVTADFEVIVVNDGSADNTAEVLEELRLKYGPRLRVVTHAQNRGYGGALRSGFAAATKEYVFYTDGDAQYDPTEMEKLLREVTPETALVNGYKMQRNDPWHRKAIGWLYNRFARWLFQIRLRDIDCDFRLIRRDCLDLNQLQSTGGSICVEIVRTLELSGKQVVEIPVHHYARQYGRSQFFRVRSLVNTFLQLCSVYSRLVFNPAWARLMAGDAELPRRRWLALAALGAVVCATLAYSLVLNAPFISDDYLQIYLGREYGPVSAWGNLAQDALYRCRATSLVLTYWIDRAFGFDPLPYGLAGLLLHIMNSLLVLALGLWKPIGWRISAVAAVLFAVTQRTSEAVVWFAAVPELLVFLFGMASFLCFVRWLQAGRPNANLYIASLVFYVLALFSKESGVAVVALCGLAVFWNNWQWRRLWSVVPMALLAAAYFGMAFAARSSHQHFNDGTFSLAAPVAEVLLRSIGGLLWVWGFAAIAFLWMVARRAIYWRGILLTALAWMFVTLLPYSFLTYMPRVPSRHTYWASVGSALIIAAAILELRRLARAWQRPWLAPAFAALIVMQQAGYMWAYKFPQYIQRAEPTERLLQAARSGESDAVYARCFPYSPQVGELALKMAPDIKHIPAFVTGPEASQRPDSLNLCNASAQGVEY